MKRALAWLDNRTRTDGFKRAFVAVAVVIVALLFALLFWKVHENGTKAAENAAVARARGQALGTANAVLTQNGIPEVKPTSPDATPGNTEVGPTTPSSTPKVGPQGVQGEQGEQGPGPSDAQVQQAVASYCADHGNCRGKPTQAQVAAAVLSYCKGDNCVGPAGADGVDATGEPGKDGQDGDRGPGPTDEQVATAVATYCANGACRGATGPSGPAGPAGHDATGAPGKDGKDAPTFAAISCTDGNNWRFDMTDGTTKYAEGPCRATTVTTTTTVTAPPSSSSSPDPTSTAP